MCSVNQNLQPWISMKQHLYDLTIVMLTLDVPFYQEIKQPQKRYLRLFIHDFLFWSFLQLCLDSLLFGHFIQRTFVCRTFIVIGKKWQFRFYQFSLGFLALYQAILFGRHFSKTLNRDDDVTTKSFIQYSLKLAAVEKSAYSKNEKSKWNYSSNGQFSFSVFPRMTLYYGRHFFFEEKFNTQVNVRTVFEETFNCNEDRW